MDYSDFSLMGQFLSLSLSLTHTHTHTLTHAHSLSHIHSQSHSHAHILSIPPSLLHTRSRSLSLFLTNYLSLSHKHITKHTHALQPTHTFTVIERASIFAQENVWRRREKKMLKFHFKSNYSFIQKIKSQSSSRQEIFNGLPPPTKNLNHGHQKMSSIFSFPDSNKWATEASVLCRLRQ